MGRHLVTPLMNSPKNDDGQVHEQFVGRWRISEMELWDRAALDLVGPAGAAIHRFTRREELDWLRQGQPYDVRRGGDEARKYRIPD